MVLLEKAEREMTLVNMTQPYVLHRRPNVESHSFTASSPSGGRKPAKHEMNFPQLRNPNQQRTKLLRRLRSGTPLTLTEYAVLGELLKPVSR